MKSDDILCRLDTIHECVEQTDRQTDSTAQRRFVWDILSGGICAFLHFIQFGAAVLQYSEHFIAQAKVAI